MKQTGNKKKKSSDAEVLLTVISVRGLGTGKASGRQMKQKISIGGKLHQNQF